MIDKIITLTEEESKRLTERPLKVAGKDFEELEDWRNRSRRSNIRVN